MEYLIRCTLIALKNWMAELVKPIMQQLKRSTSIRAARLRLILAYQITPRRTNVDLGNRNQNGSRIRDGCDTTCEIESRVIYVFMR